MCLYEISSFTHICMPDKFGDTDYVYGARTNPTQSNRIRTSFTLSNETCHTLIQNETRYTEDATPLLGTDIFIFSS
jgi:hypothetical protein